MLTLITLAKTYEVYKKYETGFSAFILGITLALVILQMVAIIFGLIYLKQLIETLNSSNI